MTEQPSRWRDWLPDAATVSWPERLRSGLGGALAILLVSLAAAVLAPSGAAPLIAASMGASAVIVFGLPTSPLGQPWPLLGGHLISALIGVLCQRWIPEPHLAAACAVGLAIVAMLACRCAHPPGGATALTAVVGGPAIHAQGFLYLLNPALAGALVILVLAWLFNNRLPGRRYPLAKHLAGTHGRRDPVPLARGPVQEADMARAVTELDLLVDLTPAELEQLYLGAERHAARRLAGPLTCGDIASHDVLSVPHDLPASEAWALLHRHNLDSAPVVDGDGRLLGLFAPAALLLDAPQPALAQDALGRWPGLTAAALLRPAPAAVAMDTPVVELIARMSDGGEHRVPLLDGAGRLAGVVSQADLIAALFHQQLFATQAGAAGPQN